MKSQLDEIYKIKQSLAKNDVVVECHALETAIMMPKNESTVIEDPKIKPQYPGIASMLFINPIEKKKKKKKGKKKKKK